MDGLNIPEEVEQERYRLLAAIKSARRPSVQPEPASSTSPARLSSSKTAPTLQKLHEEYNALVDQRNKLRRQPLADPLEALPPELWIECLLYLLSDENGPDVIYPLLLVSSSWSRKLLAVHALWNTLVLDDNPDVLHRLHAGLHLSGTLPLTVLIQLPPPTLFIDSDSAVLPDTAYAPLLEPQTKKRIRRIIFTQSLASHRAHKPGDDGPFIAFYDTAFSLLKPFKQLESLEEVKMRHEFDYYSRTLLEEGFPVSKRLRGVWRWCLPGITLERMMNDLYNSQEMPSDTMPSDALSDVRLSAMPELRHLSTNMTVERACSLLSRLPSLQHLMLTSPHARDNLYASSPSHSDPVLLSTLASTQLSMLECSQLIAPAHHPLFHLPTLTVLCLDLTWPSLSEFLQSFATLPKLTRLELGMKESDEIGLGTSPERSKGFIVPSILPDLSSVRTLILQNYDTEYWPLGDGMDEDAESLSSNSDTEDDEISPEKATTSTGNERPPTRSQSPSPRRRTASPMFAHLLHACQTMLSGVTDLTLTFRIRVSVWPVVGYLSSISSVLEKICVSGMLSTSRRGALYPNTTSSSLPKVNGTSKRQRQRTPHQSFASLPALHELTAFTSTILRFIEAPNLHTLHCPDPTPLFLSLTSYMASKQRSASSLPSPKPSSALSTPPPLTPPSVPDPSSSKPPPQLKRITHSSRNRARRQIHLRAGSSLRKVILHPAQAPLLSIMDTSHLKILHWVGGGEEVRGARGEWAEVNEYGEMLLQESLTTTQPSLSGNGIVDEKKEEGPSRKESNDESERGPPVAMGIAAYSLLIPSIEEIKFGSEAIMPEVLKFLEGLGKTDKRTSSSRPQSTLSTRKGPGAEWRRSMTTWQDFEEETDEECHFPCPNLEVMAFGGYPAFDLLLRVLETRNLWFPPLLATQGDGATTPRLNGETSRDKGKERAGTPGSRGGSKPPRKITRILLPGYPAPDTLSSIVRLLGQRLSTPDDGEGVTFSYDERYFKEKVPGCHYCFASGWRCKTPVHPKPYSFDDLVQNNGEGEDEDAQDQDAQEEGTVRAEGDVADADELDALEVGTLELDSLLGESSAAGSEESSIQESPERAYPNGSLANGHPSVKMVEAQEGDDLVSPALSKEDMSDASPGHIGTGNDAEGESSGCAKDLDLTISARPGSSRACPMTNGQTSPPRAPEETTTQNGDAAAGTAASSSASARYIEGEGSLRSQSSEERDPTNATAPVDKGIAPVSSTSGDKPPSSSPLSASAPDPQSLGRETVPESGPSTAKKGEREDEGEWMSSWWKTYDANERRFREWTAKYYREGYCLRHDPENLVEITEDTLSGVKSDWLDSYEFTEGKEDSEVG